MKVSMWHDNRDIRIEEVPTPKPGPKEMLVNWCSLVGVTVSKRVVCWGSEKQGRLDLTIATLTRHLQREILIGRGGQ